MVVFQGMSQTQCHEEYELALMDSFKARVEKLDPSAEVTVKCFSPPMMPGGSQTGWAEYTPLPGEKYKSTTNVENVAEQLGQSMGGGASGAWDWVANQFELGAIGIAVGASNGAIPAAACALYFNYMVKPEHTRMPLLVLLSGMPAAVQQDELTDYYGKVLMTVGRQEETFGGPSTFYTFASRIMADVKAFEGGHSRESEALLRKLGKMLAKDLLLHTLGKIPAKELVWF